MSNNKVATLSGEFQYSKLLNITLWTSQSIMAALFLILGILKSFLPVEQLSDMIPSMSALPQGVIRFIGMSEILGAVGLMAPSILRIKPALTSWAAIGISTIMILSIPYHISRGEISHLGMNVSILIMAVFIGWGRFKKASIQPRS